MRKIAFLNGKFLKMTLRQDPLIGAIGYIVFQLVCLVTLCLIFFNRNELALYYGYDGSYMRQLVKFYFEWSEPTTQLIVNPLQGLSSFAFPINYWFSPACLISYFLFGPEPNPVVVYTVLTIELFAVVWLLAHWIGVSREVKLGATWSAAILAM